MTTIRALLEWAEQYSPANSAIFSKQAPAPLKVT